VSGACSGGTSALATSLSNFRFIPTTRPNSMAPLPAAASTASAFGGAGSKTREFPDNGFAT
jgi:hypothetical protein